MIELPLPMIELPLLAVLFLSQAPAPSTAPPAQVAKPSAATAEKSASKPAEETVLALTGAVVHTMVQGETPTVRTIVVRGQRVSAIGPSEGVPEGARRVDLAGKHVIPGLIDGMVNHDSDHDRLYVTAGVTLVRDIGSDVARIFGERDREHVSGARDRGPGPDILCAGGILDGADSVSRSAIVLDTLDAVKDKIPRLLELGPDFLSFYSGLKEPVLRKVAELGHAKGLSIWGTKLVSVDLAAAAAAGQDGLFNLEALLPPGKSWPDATLENLRGGIETVVARKLLVTPTLSVFAVRILQPPEKPPELAYLAPLYVKSWLGEAGLRQKVMDKTPDYQRTGLRVVEMQSQLVKTLFDRGVTIVPGSGSPNPWLFPGKALVDELALLARAGIPKPAVLALATSGAAKALGVDKDRGTIAPGRIADLVVLPSDPRADLAVLHSPEAVVLRGRYLDRAEMDALRSDLSERQKRVQGEMFQALQVPDPEMPEGEILLRGTTETRALGERLAGESFAVVRAKDGSLVYASRSIVQGSASAPSNEVEAQQTIHDGALTAFRVKIKAGSRNVELVGTLAGGTLNVERHADGGFLGTIPVKDRVAFLDTGSVTSVIALGQRTVEGKFKTLFFEDLEPAVGTWEMHLDPTASDANTKLLLARTQSGALTAKFKADGSLDVIRREEGNTITETRPLSMQGFKGGLPVPEKSKG
jgi:hypothetical protein